MFALQLVLNSLFHFWGERFLKLLNCFFSCRDTVSSDGRRQMAVVIPELTGPADIDNVLWEFRILDVPDARI